MDTKQPIRVNGLAAAIMAKIMEHKNVIEQEKAKKEIMKSKYNIPEKKDQNRGK